MAAVVRQRFVVVVIPGAVYVFPDGRGWMCSCMGDIRWWGVCVQLTVGDQRAYARSWCVECAL